MCGSHFCGCCSTMSVLNDLVVDRKLLDKDFEGYKLSLAPIPVYKEEFDTEVDLLRPNEEQYSFLHHREFSLHNHLFHDQWNKEVVYFVDSKWKIRRSWMNELERLEKIVDVWEIPKSSKQPLYNTSLCFGSSDVAVVCDGAGMIYILETSTRADIVPWKALHNEEVLGDVCYKMIDARCVGESPNRVVHLLLVYIDPCDTETSEDSNAKFQTVLNWVTLVEEITGYWSKKSVNVFKAKGPLDYAAVEPDGTGIFVISSKSFCQEEPMEIAEEKIESPDFFWQQSYEDIKLWFNLPENTLKSDIKVITGEENIKITIKDVVFIDGHLTNSIDPDLTTWKMEDSKFQITMQKMAEGTMWVKFVETDKIGKEIMDAEIVADVHEKLAHLCSEKEEGGSSTVLNTGQLEECDAFDESRLLVRINDDSKLTHKVLVGSQQWLLTTQIHPDKPPAFCIRNDVDGLVWQPESPSQTDKTWKCEHIGTFLAFGYIQASKINRKFTTAPPDLSYITIVDVTGHVMLFRKGIAVAGQLRNRKTGRNLKEIAVQNLVNLQTNNEIVGAVATDKYCFVLTKKSLHVLHVS